MRATIKIGSETPTSKNSQPMGERLPRRGGGRGEKKIHADPKNRQDKSESGKNQ